jgi:HlyD family secretion protein
LDRAVRVPEPVARRVRQPWIRWALWLGLAAAVVSAAYLVLLRRPLTVDVATVEANVPVRVFGLGTVEAQVLSKIGFEVSS